MEFLNWLIPVIIISVIWLVIIITLQKKSKLNVFPVQNSRLRHFYYRGKIKFILINGILIMGGILFMFLIFFNEFIIKGASFNFIINNLSIISRYFVISILTGLIWSLYTWNLICKKVNKQKV